MTFTKPFGLSNRLGMSMIEVLVALAMAGVLSAVVASIMQQVFKAQKQSNVLNTIEGMRLNIQKLATDGTAWRATVALAANSGTGQPLECVQTHALCTNNTAAAGINSDPTVANSVLDAAPFVTLVHLEQATGGSYIDTTAANTGYTDQGAPCATFSLAGNDACPIRWVIKMAYECQGAVASCLNPTIRIVAVLYYRPLNRTTVVNEGKYRVDIRRGAQGDMRAEKFSAEYSDICGAGCTPSDFPGNGGICLSTGTPIPWLTTASPALPNEGNNVTIVGGASGILQFKAGTYTCSASSSCFACGSVSLALRVNGTNIFVSNKMLSNPWNQTQVSFDQVTFTVTATSTDVRVLQYCATDPGGNPALQYLGLGIALPSYTSKTKFAEINCTRIF